MHTRNMDQLDVAINLRKLEFPACVQKVLPIIENMVVSRAKPNLIMQLTSEFVFMERSKDSELRHGQSSVSCVNMNKMEEFQLILILIEFFSQPGPDSTRNAVFLSLFSANLTPQRTRILCKLISTSVSGSVTGILSSAGTWMQQVGCTTHPSLEVAQSLVSDFILFSRKTSDQIKQLPLVAAHFASNLITAVADLYLNEQSGNLIAPPDTLLDVFCEWISENSSLCLASQQPLALPSGAIAMPVTTPLAGLIRWSVLSPLVSNSIAYCNLHLALLKSLLKIERKETETPALNAQQLILIVQTLKNQKAQLTNDNGNPSENDNYNICLERFAEAIQISLHVNCVAGNIPQLLCALETLPNNDLMNLVIKANKKKLIN